MNTPAPLQSQQLYRTARLVNWLGLTLGSVMAYSGASFSKSLSDEAHAFVAVGASVCLVSFLWAMLLRLKAMRMQGKGSDLQWQILLSILGAMSLVLIFGSWGMLDWALVVLILSPVISWYTAANLSMLYVHGLETQNNQAPHWPEAQRLQAGQKRYRKLSVLLIAILIPLPVLYLCAQTPKPYWHEFVMTHLPRPLNDWTYKYWASQDMKWIMLHHRALSDEFYNAERKRIKEEWYKSM